MEIKNYSVIELSLVEKKEINGGNILWKLLAAVGVAIIEDWDNFKKGLAGEPEIAK
ncbi:MAG: hypothetical protein IPN68_19670 [Bacteroidetes bacterium]|nr:hypothetical protein [Bacteroidota bacterium]